MSKYLIEGSSLTAIGSAIRTKTGDSSLLSVPTGMVNAITNIPTGGGSRTVAKEYKDVNFFDWDGTLLFSYTTAEFLALSAFPTYPERDDTVFYQWNWTLAGAKKQVSQVYPKLNIASECYANDPDGAGWIDVVYMPSYLDSISTNIPSVQLSFEGVLGETHYAMIDWGDGQTQELTITANVGYVSHNYSVANKDETFRIRVYPSEKEPNRINNCNIRTSNVQYLRIQNIYDGDKTVIGTIGDQGNDVTYGYRCWCSKNDVSHGSYCPMSNFAYVPNFTHQNDGYTVPFTDSYYVRTLSLPENNIFNNIPLSSSARLTNTSIADGVQSPIILSYKMTDTQINLCGSIGSIRPYGGRIPIVIPVFKDENNVWVCPLLENYYNRTQGLVYTGHYSNGVVFIFYHKPDTIPNIISNSFGTIRTNYATTRNPHIYVPYGTKTDFVNASEIWATYTDYIEELPQEA